MSARWQKRYLQVSTLPSKTIDTMQTTQKFWIRTLHSWCWCCEWILETKEWTEWIVQLFVSTADAFRNEIVTVGLLFWLWLHLPHEMRWPCKPINNIYSYNFIDICWTELLEFSSIDMTFLSSIHHACLHVGVCIPIRNGIFLNHPSHLLFLHPQCYPLESMAELNWAIPLDDCFHQGRASW